MSKPMRFILNEDTNTRRPAIVQYSSSKNKITLLLGFLFVLVVFAIGAVGYNFYQVKSAVIIPNTEKTPDSLPDLNINVIPSDVLPKINFGEERVNFLLLGLDRRRGETAELSRTDSIMFTSLNIKDKSVVMISIPRDLEVEFPPDSGQFIKINAVHNHPTVNEERGAGPRALKQVVGNIFGVKVHYFARIDFTGFEQGIDELGGITIDVPEKLVDYEYPDNNDGWMTIRIEAGKQVMNGQTALQYARSRHATNPNLATDESRAQRQQQVLIAAKEKILLSSPELLTSPQKIGSFLDILKDSFLTDIQITEMISLAAFAAEIDTTNQDKIIMQVLKEPLIYHEDQAGKDWRYYPADQTWDDIQQWVEELFTNPYLRQNLQQESALIQIQNATVQSGLAKAVVKQLNSYPLRFLDPTSNPDSAAHTQIIDYTNGLKAHTLDFLEQYFGIKATLPDKIYPNQKADIIVILGEDYILSEN